MGKKHNVSFFALKIAEKLSNLKNFRLRRLSAPQGRLKPGNNGQKFSRQEWLRKWNVKFLRVKFCSKKSTKL